MLYTKTFNNSNIDLRTHTFGTQKCPPGHFYGYAIRSHYLIHYIHSGRGTYLHGSTRTDLGPGEAFLILPGEATYYSADTKYPWEYSWVSFSGESSEPLLEAAGFLNDNLSITGSADSAESYDAIFRKMKVFSEHETGYLGITGLLLEFLFEAACSKGGSVLSDPGDYVSYIKKFISTEYHHKLTVSGIAEILNLDRSYMTALFKKSTGRSVQEYILDLRIDKARTLLKDSRLPVKSIALSVGYTDQLAFSKIFKSRTGLSPANFRKSIRL